MPTHSPENPEPFYELAYPGEDQHMRATVTYWRTEDDGHPYDPDAPGKADWESRVVFDEPVDQVDLDTDADRRRVAVAILADHLKMDATDEDIETFMVEIAEPDGWADGQMFVVSGERLSRIW